MPYAADEAMIVIHMADNESTSTGSIAVCLGDETLPTLDQVYTKAAGIADNIRLMAAAAFNRIDGRVIYRDAAAVAAQADSEVEKRAVVELLTTAGNTIQISIPGVKPALFQSGALRDSDADVVALLEALTVGIGGVRPVDKHGDEVGNTLADGYIRGYKQHRKSFRG